MNKKYSLSNTNDDLLKAYFRDISKYKILDSETLNNCINKAHNGDLKARDKVVTSNLRFVVTLAKSFQNRGIEMMDLIIAGTEGLIKAVDKFDTTRGVPFLSYASWWIKQAMYNTIYWHSREIRLPVSQQMNVIKIIDATNKFIKKNGRNPTTNELHELTELPATQIDYLAQFFNKLVSVDDFIGGDEDHSQVCEVIPDGEKPLEDQINTSFVVAEIVKCFKILSNREHDVMCLLYGVEMPAISKYEIAAMFGIGIERIRQIREKALDKIRRRCNLQLSKLL